MHLLTVIIYRNHILSGTSCQDVDFFFLSDFHDVGLVLTSKICYNIFENLTQEWINFMELRLCLYSICACLAVNL